MTSSYRLLLLACTGCVLGGGPVVGYGTKHGVYAGVAGGAGVSVAQATAELGGTSRGAIAQARLDLQLSKLRFTDWNAEVGRPYPGVHGGIGYGLAEGWGGLATMVGPDVGVLRDNSYCTGAPVIYVGVDWRYLRGESQFVLAPRYEKIWDICLP